jgi:hypothetical protein
MDQNIKAAILHDVIRKFAAGGKDITPDAWREFVEAQNDGYSTGPEIGDKVPDFTLPDLHGKSWAAGRPDGIKWAAAGLQPQCRLVTLLPQAARRAAALSWKTQGARG